MRYITIITCCLLYYGPATAQVGAGTLHLQAGVIFSADSLVLIPSADITITGNTLTHNYITIPGTQVATNSIGRVYNWATNVTDYSGSIGIIYSDAELAGNPELSLQIAYNNGNWTTTSTSTVDPVANYVAYTGNNLSFRQITATSAGVILPIVYAGFTAALREQYVSLDWNMADMEDLESFDVEYSADGRNWQAATRLRPAPGQTRFTYDHKDLNFSTRYYRIAGIDTRGVKTYSSIATVRNSGAGNNLRIVRQGQNTLLYFQGTAPAAVQLYDMKGQLLQTRTVVQQQCEINGLRPGAYVIFYIVEGQKLTRKIQL
ncbi:T9SS type A sorting domain-containing protein [Paraflavitalea pollutisoli]|uniref:T9SS type A sorting domain-containing protein n=1 Tax=Paraflavitalea pollutisoli TaxID=3034143 RepID=UPI0023ECE710|nr:T9SS type A sorting domain-containing protein [Paraflavitalea sp. H1-2-19X]